MKASSSISVTLLGMVIEVREEQAQNASSPIFVTPSGIPMEVNAEQPLKAELLMLVKPLGRSTDVSDEQSSYLQLIVHQLVLVETVEKCWRRFYGWRKRLRINVFNYYKPQNARLCAIFSSLVNTNRAKNDNTTLASCPFQVCWIGWMTFILMTRSLSLFTIGSNRNLCS